MTQLNGINYTEILLTDEELAVVKAMRNRAAINVSYWYIEDIEEVINKANEFGDIQRIYDLDGTVAFSSGDLASKLKCSIYVRA